MFFNTEKSAHPEIPHLDLGASGLKKLEDDVDKLQHKLFTSSPENKAAKSLKKVKSVSFSSEDKEMCLKVEMTEGGDLITPQPMNASPKLAKKSFANLSFYRLRKEEGLPTSANGSEKHAKKEQCSRSGCQVKPSKSSHFPSGSHENKDNLMHAPNFAGFLATHKGDFFHLIEECIKRLIALEAYKCEGIGRISGSTASLNEIFTLSASGQDGLAASKDPHVIMKLLKQLLRTPEALVISDSLLAKFLSLQESKLEDYQQFLSQIEPIKRKTLASVLHFFYLVATNQETTKMMPASCAICLAQNLVNTGSSFEAATQANNVVEFMITYYKELFPSH